MQKWRRTSKLSIDHNIVFTTRCHFIALTKLIGVVTTRLLQVSLAEEFNFKPPLHPAALKQKLLHSTLLACLQLNHTDASISAHIQTCTPHFQGDAQSAVLIGQSVKENPSFIALRKIEAAREIAHTIANSASRVYLPSDSLLLNVNEHEKDVSVGKKK